MLGQNLKIGLQKGLVLLFAGLAIGVLAGWVSLITAEGADALAASAARFYPLFGLAAVAILILQAYFDLRGTARIYYHRLGDALLILITTALAGIMGGTVFFIGAAAQIPAVFGREKAADTVLALYPAIGLDSFIILLIISLLVAIFAAILAQRQFRNDPPAVDSVDINNP